MTAKMNQRSFFTLKLDLIYGVTFIMLTKHMLPPITKTKNFQGR